MRKLVLLFFALAVFSVAYSQSSPWRKGEMEVRIPINGIADAALLASFNYNCDIYNNFALAYLVPAELDKVKNAGLAYEVTKPDLNAWSKSFGAALVPQGYYTFQQIKNIADSLAANFPSICKKVIFGYNAQMQELAALKISDSVEIDQDEPEIMFDGGIHGDEVGGPQNIIQFARDLCLGYGVDPQITNLVDNREIWLYYCVNPFGRDNMTRYNSATVDINRDNGYMWGGEGNSPGPFSQPETKALRACQYSNQFVAYTNYHSGTETISYPWSYRYSPIPDKPSVDHLAQVYSSASGYTSLPYGQGSVIMYLIQGSTKDFNYGSLGSVAWSIEISLDKQTPEVQHYYTINKSAMLALIEHVGYGIQGVITDAITGKPVNASIFVGANYPVYSDPEVGDFHKYLIAGTYDLKIVANGYETKNIPGVVVNNLQCTTVNAQLNPVSSQYAYRVVSAHIPSFNAQNPGDESYTAACLGAPDNVNYSLGRGGYIIVDMQDTIVDTPGANDIAVYEGDSTPEGFTLYSGPTMDGPWTNLGFATGSSQFDLQTYGVDKARYFMLLDDNNGQFNVDNAGFDFDAIVCLHPAKPDTVGHLTGYVYNAVTLMPLAGATVSFGDSSAVTNSDGWYAIEVNRGSSIVCSSRNNYMTHCDTLLVQPASSLTHDFYLFSTDGLPGDERPAKYACIYPNPFTSDFTLELNFQVKGNFSFELFDFTGVRVYKSESQNVTSGISRFSSNQLLHGNVLAPGNYFMLIHTPDSNFPIKFIKTL
ncbi:MAG: T9SS type A sorting domain-containing protein [Bacteroidetes bacterium]|nr:T9SS type A sorting domain-containing protein [Bacteroidota bacterium]